LGREGGERERKTMGWERKGKERGVIIEYFHER